MAASLPGDCAQVRQLIAEKKVSADALCRAIVSVSSTTLSPMAAINYRCRSLPHTEDYWTAFDRFYACVHDRRVLQFFRPATLSVVGSIPLNTYAAVQLDRKSLTPTTMVESSLGLRSGTGTVTAISPKNDRMLRVHSAQQCGHEAKQHPVPDHRQGQCRIARRGQTA